jgi:hypothetical protein
MAGGARGRSAAGAVLPFVFTLPAAIADIAYQNTAVIYDLLFKAFAETLTTIAADPKHLGARVGITSVPRFDVVHSTSAPVSDTPGQSTRPSCSSRLYRFTLVK